MERQVDLSSFQSFNFLGTDLVKVPCLKWTLMAGLSSGMMSGIVYNLATSRPPWKMFAGTYTGVTLTYW